MESNMNIIQEYELHYIDFEKLAEDIWGGSVAKF